MKGSSLKQKEVPQQSRGLKGLVAAGRDSDAAGKEPLQYVHSHANSYWHPEAVTVTLH